MEQTATVYNLEITLDNTTYRPTITINDHDRMWKIENHEGLRARLGEDAYGEWLLDFRFALLTKNCSEGSEFFTEVPHPLLRK